MTEERWVPARGYEDLYEVSDAGRVRRRSGTPRCIRARILNPVPLKRRGGYLMVALWKENRGLCHRVNRLVFESFNGVDLPSDIDVHHKNTDRTDNALSNLEALPESQHYGLGVHNMSRGERHSHSLFTEDQVREIRLLHKHGERGSGYRSIGDIYGVRSEYIRDIVKRKTWSHVA